jgi:hypothetical protein
MFSPNERLQKAELALLIADMIGRQNERPRKALRPQASEHGEPQGRPRVRLFLVPAAKLVK